MLQFCKAVSQGSFEGNTPTQEDCYEGYGHVKLCFPHFFFFFFLFVIAPLESYFVIQYDTVFGLFHMLLGFLGQGGKDTHVC